METKCPGADVPNQRLAANWNPVENVHFDEFSPFAAYSFLTRDQEITSSQISSFGNQRFQETLTSFDFPHGYQLATASDALDFPSGNHHSFENNFKGKKRKGLLGCDTSASISSLPDGDKKDVPSESIPGNDEGKQNNTPKPASMTHSNSKTGKGHLQEGNASEEEYIHVRAKHGRATNSHSLAERVNIFIIGHLTLFTFIAYRHNQLALQVRREKISQRMKLLQAIVPGCNKITGKAVMLDEVINYVQSLQCQVEFLSMKLAAVNPTINFDIEQMLSKDMLRLRDRSSAVSAFASRMPSINNSQLCESSLLRVMRPEAMSRVQESENMLRTYFANVPNISQLQMPNLWDDELQNVGQMNYISNVPSSSMEHGT